MGSFSFSIESLWIFNKKTYILRVLVLTYIRQFNKKGCRSTPTVPLMLSVSKKTKIKSNRIINYITITFLNLLEKTKENSKIDKSQPNEVLIIIWQDNGVFTPKPIEFNLESPFFGYLSIKIQSPRDISVKYCEKSMIPISWIYLEFTVLLII